MIHKTPIACAAVSLTMICIAACSSNNEPAGTEQPETTGGKPVTAMVQSPPPGKPTAPIDIRYEVIGNAIVGVPVAINVVITSEKGPITVEFSINDGSALMFQPGQVERLDIADPSSGSVQQITVIPQREGRVYVNVSAEMQTADGLNIRSMAIPIKVGGAPEKATVNGQLLQGPGGEPVISMPANESN